jgi:hypothetical protein
VTHRRPGAGPPAYPGNPSPGPEDLLGLLRTEGVAAATRTAHLCGLVDAGADVVEGGGHGGGGKVGLDGLGHGGVLG